MKKFYTLLIALFIVGGALGQGCLPNGITFNSQASIDNFQSNYPNCHYVEGSVLISGDDIISLDGLIVLDSIKGDLSIVENPLLSNLIGLENLKKIGEYWGNILYIDGNESLTSLNGLQSLQIIEGNLQIGNNSRLNNLLGLNNLTIVGGTLLAFGDSLMNFDGLENLQYIGGDLSFHIIKHCVCSPMLTDISALSNLTAIGGTLKICGCNSLASLAGLENLTSIGNEYSGQSANIEVYENSALISLSGIDNIDENTISDVYIYENPELSTCEVQSICSYLAIPGTPSHIYNNAPGCNSEQEVEDACESVSIDEISNLKNVTVYPNPVQSSIIIELPTQPSKNTTLTISNTNGQRLITKPITKPQTEIDISHLPVGIYIVKVWNDKEVMVQKVIKQ